MRKKNTIIVIISLLASALFIGTAAMPAIAITAADNDSLNLDKEIKQSKESEECPLCAERLKDVDSTPSLSKESGDDSGCKTCEEAVQNAWEYAKTKADEEVDIPEIDLSEYGLLGKLNIILLQYRSTIRRYFIRFSVHFADGLYQESEELPFTPVEAVAGSALTFFSELIKIILQYGFFLGQAILQALIVVKDYVIDLCDGDGGGGGDPPDPPGSGNTLEGLVSLETTVVASETTQPQYGNNAL